MIERCIFRIAAVLLWVPLLGACDDREAVESPGSTVPEGMVEIRPALPGRFGVIPRTASEAGAAATRAYDDHSTTDGKLGTPQRLPDGSTVWLIARNTRTKKLVKNSYVVRNSGSDVAETSYLYPCVVDDEGRVTSADGTPLYLKRGEKYLFYAVSPARKLDDDLFARGAVGFCFKNGEAFCAHDSRYAKTFPTEIPTADDADGDLTEIGGAGAGFDSGKAVQYVKLKPMINQTALLKFQILKDATNSYVHDLDIQPSGIQISGLQNDRIEKANSKYGNTDGVAWHMSLGGSWVEGEGENAVMVYDEPINLQYSDKSGSLNSYNYTIDDQKRINIEVPIIPMWDMSKPVIVVFRLKVNGVPSTYEMMLNEKDFKAGYSYGYRGTVTIEEGVSVMSWQFVSWSYDVGFPF